jgi:hypothetical protein
VTGGLLCGGGYPLFQEEARFHVEQHLKLPSRHFCDEALAASLAARCQIVTQPKTQAELLAEEEARLDVLGLKQLPAAPLAEWLQPTMITSSLA